MWWTATSVSVRRVITTLLFVHGTGVRGERYAETLRAVQAQVTARAWPVRVVGCYWGDAVGARLALGGRSVPEYERSKGAGPTPVEQTRDLWAVLYVDPWYELRLLRDFPPQPVGFGVEPPADAIRRQIAEFRPSDTLTAELAEHRLGVEFAEAWAGLRAAPEFAAAARTAPADPLEHRGAIARAVVAYATARATAAGRPALGGTAREQPVDQLTADLHGSGLGVGTWLATRTKRLGARAVTSRLVRNRGGLTDAAAPLAGDVLRYLARGEAMRAYLRRTITDQGSGPIVLLGHSLGGIMCVDLLAHESILSVTTLITVGSQAPFLYEIGALPSLESPQPLPASFPRWINVHDRDDLLSYSGAGVFGDRVRDVCVDNGEPFPASHSAYWSNDEVWAAIESLLE
ncbi:hypothetical protein SKPI104516_01925 [Skermania piniformis]